MRVDMMFYETNDNKHKRLLINKNGNYIGFQIPDGGIISVDGDMVHVVIPKNQVKTLLNGVIALASELLERVPEVQKAPYAVSNFRPKVVIDEEKIYEDIDVNWDGYIVVYECEDKAYVEYVKDPEKLSANFAFKRALIAPISKEDYIQLMDALNLPYSGLVQIKDKTKEDFFLSYLAYLLSIGVRLYEVEGSTQGVIKYEDD